MGDLILTAVATMATVLTNKVGEDAYGSLKTYLCDRLGLRPSLRVFERQPDSDEQQKWLAEDLKDSSAATDPEFERLVKVVQGELESRNVDFQSALRIRANEGAFITLGEVDIVGSAGVDISENPKATIKVKNIKVRS